MTLTVRPIGAAMRMLMLLLGLTALSQEANAACSSPTGTGGDMTYSTSANVMAYCDGQNWISMNGGVSLTVNTSGGVTPYGSTGDIQINNGGALGGDTGNFKYSASTLSTPIVSASTANITTLNSAAVNNTGLGTFGSILDNGGLTVLGAASMTTISATAISGTIIQVGTGGGASCSAGINGALKYDATSNTIAICVGSTWTSLASGTITGSGVSGGSATAIAFWNGPSSLTYESATTSGLYWDHPNGRLGVGTNTPAYPLEISNTGISSTAAAVNIAAPYSQLRLTDTDDGKFVHFSYSSGRLLIRDNVADSGVTPSLALLENGTVGIGTSNPAAKLDVTGEIKVGSTGAACSSSISGSIRYNTTSNTMDYCSGTAWLSLGPSGTTIPAFSVFRSTTQTGGVNIKIVMDTKKFDTYNNYDLSTNKFTPTVAGKYIFTGFILCTAGSSQFVLYKNGSTYQYGGPLAAANDRSYLTAIVDMNGTTDYVEPYGYCSNGASSNFGGSGSNGFAGALIASAAAGGGGTATPAGSTGDVQFNTSGALDADTGGLFYDKTNHRLGLGTGTPSRTIDVSGSIRTYGASNGLELNTGNTGGGIGANLYFNTSTKVTGLQSIEQGVQYLPILLNPNGGTVGIGTTLSPTVKLDVNGEIKVGSTGASCSSSISGSIRYNTTSNTIDYCSGSAWTSLSSNTTGGSVTGGTANYGAIFSGVTTLTTDTALYVDTTNHRLGLGTSTPSYGFEVSGSTVLVSVTGTSTPALQVTGGYAGNDIARFIRLTYGGIAMNVANGNPTLTVSGSSAVWGMSNIGNNLMIAPGSLSTNMTNGLLMATNGKVGINRTSGSTPLATLDVAGTISSSDAIQVGTSSLTCSNSISGSIRYNTTSNTIDYCSGSTWRSLNTASGTATLGLLAYSAGTQSIPNSTVTTLTDLTTVSRNDFGASSLSAGVFTVPSGLGGWYHISGHYNVNACSTSVVIFILVNNAISFQSGDVDNNTGACADRVSTEGSLYLSAGDTVKLQVSQISGAAHNTTTYASLGVVRLPDGITNGSGGTATPAGSTNDIQFNSGGALAADTGNFTYTTSGGLLKVTNISVTTNITGAAASFTGQGTFGSVLVNGGATITGLSSLTTVSASTISVTTLQIGAGGTCASGTAGTVRYNSTSSTIDVCVGTAWTSLASGTITGSGISGGSATAIAFWNGASSLTYESASTAALYWDHPNGRLGVGTTAPSATLSVSGTARIDNGGIPYLNLSRNGSGDSYLGVSSGGGSFFAGNSANNLNVRWASGQSLFLGADNGSGTANPSMVISGSGNVGIGTTAPSTTLHVNGEIKVGSTGLACSNPVSGSIRYNGTNAVIEFCNGTSWTTVGPSFGSSLTAFTVVKSATQSLVAGNTVTWDTAITNNGGAFNTGTGQFTAPATGLYFFIATLLNNSDKSLNDYYVYKNGTITALRSYDNIGNAANVAAYYPATVQGVLFLVAGDKIDIRAATTETLYGGNGNSVSTFSGFIINAGSGGGGTATPAGSTNDIQFNSGGALAADSGNFTYASSVLTAPTVSGTYHYGQYGSFTTLYNPGSFSGNTAALNSVSSTLVSATYISVTTGHFNSVAGASVSGVGGNSIVSGSAAATTYSSGVIQLNGSVAIPGSSPASAARLDVSGTIYSRAFNAGSSTSIDWSQGNVQYTTAACGAFTFTNMLDGGMYTLGVINTSGSCTFAQSGLTTKTPGGTALPSITANTIYSFVRMGSNLFVSYVGF